MTIVIQVTYHRSRHHTSSFCVSLIPIYGLFIISISGANVRYCMCAMRKDPISSKGYLQCTFARFAVLARSTPAYAYSIACSSSVDETCLRQSLELPFVLTTAGNVIWDSIFLCYKDVPGCYYLLSQIGPPCIAVSTPAAFS